MKRLTVIVALAALAMAAQAQAGWKSLAVGVAAGRASKSCDKCEPCVCKCSEPAPEAPPKPIHVPTPEEDRERMGAVCALGGGVYLPDDPLYEVGECDFPTLPGWRCCYPNRKPERPYRIH